MGPALPWRQAADVTAETLSLERNTRRYKTRRTARHRHTHTWPLDRCIDWLARRKRVWRHARTRLQAKVGTWQVYGQKASAVFTKGHLALSATVLRWSRSYGRWWIVSRLLFANFSPECTVLFFLIL